MTEDRSVSHTNRVDMTDTVNLEVECEVCGKHFAGAFCPRCGTHVVREQSQPLVDMCEG